MWNWFAALPPPDQLKAVALVGVSIAFVVGLFQYRKSQRWKRAEWVAQEMQAFFSDPAVNSALRLLDWSTRRVDLFPDRQDPAQRFVVVRDDDLAKALARHSDRPEGFTDVEAALRDLFDHFLDRLERINSFVEARLVSLRDVRPYLDYWAEHVVCAGVGRPKVARLVQLQRYIRYYGYSGVEALFTQLSGRAFPPESDTLADERLQPAANATEGRRG
jgi:hypothetical protein